jgi:hypothetical protein
MSPQGMPAPPDQQSGIANTLAGNDPPVSAYGQEMDRLRPIMDDKINNFMEALAGPAPDQNTREQAQGMLTGALGIDPDDILHHYVKYKQSNPVRRGLTDVMVHHLVNSNADSYVNDVLTRKMPWFENLVRPQDAEMVRSPQSEAIATYQRAVLSNLRNLLQDKKSRDAVIKHLTDFRTLEQPIPFVRSKVNYLPPPPE